MVLHHLFGEGLGVGIRLLRERKLARLESERKAALTIKRTISFGPEMVAYLLRLAKRNGTTFSDQVRCHVAWGWQATGMEPAE